MLETVFAPLIGRYINAYVDGFDNKQLSLGGLWTGDIKASNLKLKRGALDKFRLPVDVLEGYLDSLSISVPWSNLKGKPVKITIENVFLVAVPAAETKYDPEDDARRKQQLKMDRLENSELLTSKPSMGSTPEDDLKNQSFVSSLVNRVVDNFQISIKNVHIRYEDKLSVPGHPFAVGMTLGEFSAHSTDEFWQPTFLVNRADGVHKIGNLGSLSVYFDTDTPSIAGLPYEQAKEKFLSLIHTDDRPVEHQYILKPVSGEGRLTVRNGFSKEHSRIHLDLIFQELGFVLDSDQYRDALSMVDLFHFYNRQHQYRPLRPAEIEFSENKPRALLKFALGAIRHEVHEKHRVWSWDYFRQRRDDRKAYIAAFKKHAIEPNAADAKAECDRLELVLAYRDLRLYRSMARSEMRKDRISAERATEEQKRLNPDAAKQQPNRGWVGWFFGGSGQAQEAEQPQDMLTTEQRKELYDAIDFDEKEVVAAAAELPRELVKFHVTASLDTGSFLLRQNPDGQLVDMISIVFDGLAADVLQRTDNLEAAMSLGGMRVLDGTLPNSLHKQVVSVKKDDKARLGSTITEDDRSKQVSRVNRQDAFFFASFEQNPLDERADTGLTVILRYMEIFYHRGYVEEIVRFFRPPASQLESVAALVDVASETLEGLRKETRAGLEFALQNHKTVDLKLDMNAPIIIIPEDMTSENSLHMIVDAGHISIESSLADKSALKDVRDKASQQYSDEDWKRLENLMYDRFHVKLESTQILLGRNLAECQTALAKDEASHVHLLERINMDWLAENAIVPNVPNLPRFKVSGRLPDLSLNFSDWRYKSLMRMIDVALPRFDEEEASPDLVLKNAAAEQSAARARRKSFAVRDQFDEVEEVHAAIPDIDDADNDAESDVGIEDKAEDKFFEAPDVVDSRSVGIAQDKFRFSFAVDRLSANILKTNAGQSKDELLLAVATFEGLRVDFASRPYDMEVDVVLHSLSIADKMVPANSRFDHIISSVANSTESNRNLIQVKYHRCDPTSPQFMTVHEGFNQSVDVQMSTFNVVVTRASILMLFDFVLSTFTDSNGSRPQLSAADVDTPLDVIAAPSDGPLQKLRVRVKLNGIDLLLNDDGEQLATLTLSAADIAILLRGPTMRVTGRLGNMTVVDDMATHLSPDADFRQLLRIKGSEVADFQYETFDANEPATYPGYDTYFALNTGSLQFLFLEEPVHRLIRFLTQFARMKAILDAARAAAAQQATELAERAPRMHFDIKIKTPIIVFPRDAQSTDLLVAHLGEIKAVNTFDKSTNSISASLRSIRLTSHLSEEGETSELQLLSNVDLQTDVVLLDENPTKVKANLSDIKMALTEKQFAFLMELSRQIPRAFGSTAEESDADAKADHNFGLKPHEPNKSAVSQTEVDLSPEVTPHRANGDAVALKVSLQLNFAVSAISLDIFGIQATSAENLKSYGIAHFSINKTSLTAKMFDSGAMEAELLVRNFVVTDLNLKKGTKYREIIPAMRSNDSYQLMVSLNMSGGEERSAIANVTLDTPTVMFALDPVFAILNFITSPFRADPQPEQAVTDDSDDDTSTLVESAPSSMSFAYRVNIVSAKVMLLANPHRSDTEAIQLTIEQVLLAQQGTLVLSATKMGMFLCHMDRQDDRIRVLDDLDMTLSLDNRIESGQNVSNIEITVQDIILRASYRDLALVQSIVTKAIELSSQPTVAAENNRSLTSRQSIASDKASQKAQIQTPASKKTRVTVVRESLRAGFDGFQLILIDLQELPLVLVRTEKFLVLANDWSRDLHARVTISPLINFFNLSTSHWEPVLDPWDFTIAVNRNAKEESTAVSLTSRKRLELNIAAKLIEQAYTTYNVWLREGEAILRKDRGSRSPFLIRNRTGYTVSIWPESDTQKETPEPTKLETGKDTPWRFDDWKTMREHIHLTSHNALSIAFEDTQWERLKHVSVDREGEHIYALRPKLDRVTHRLLCEVKLVNNIKEITLRSTLNVENLTLIPTEMIVVAADGQKASPVFKIGPGGSCPVPIEAAYHQRIRIRPDAGFGYGWSTKSYHWQDLVKKRKTTIVCNPHDPGAHFLFQAYTVCDIEDPLLRTYPRMTLRMRPPVEVENLLPYDIKFRIYDKNTKHNYSSFLRKGGTAPIHLADLAHLILISIEIQHTQFQRSEFAIINTDNPDDLPIENEITIADKDGLTLKLRINYVRYSNAGDAFKIQIYSPFVFINKTGCDFALKSKTRFGPAKNVAGHSIFAKDSKRTESHPFLFAYSSDDRRNRALLRINDSEWSEPITFEAVGTAIEVKLPRSHQSGLEYLIGLRVSEGMGIYKLTRVVTIYPRYLVKNFLNETIRLCQDKSANIVELKPGEREPFLEVQAVTDPLLSIGLVAHDSWSVPFQLQQVGTNYLRYNTNTSEQMLLRVDIALEGAVLHIQVHKETLNWPFVISNTSGVDLHFHQTALDEGDQDGRDVQPMSYTVKSGATLQYAWDYLVGAKRSITLYAGKSSRVIDLMKIGQAEPFVFKDQDKKKLLSIDISAEASSQLVLFSDYREEDNLFKIDRRAPTMTRQSSVQEFEFIPDTADTTGKFDVTISLEGVGISLVNRKMQELAYTSFRGFELKYTDTKSSQSIALEVKWIQIDNQLFGGIFPIILYPTEIPTDGKDLEAHPNFSLSALLLKDHAHGVIHFQFLTILLQQMTIEIDEDFIFALIDFAQLGGSLTQNANESRLIDEAPGIPEPELTSNQNELFFELFALQPIQLDISFMRTENMNSETKTFLDNRNPAAYFLNALTMALGNVNDAPIQFNYLFLENARLPFSVLLERIILHYSTAFYGQLYRILGSADFLGNPIGLFQNVSSGVGDIFYAPYEGFVLHGGDVGYALAKGAGSFVKKTVFGVSDSMAKVTGSIGKGLSAATLDKDFQSRRRMRRMRNKPKHALYGVTSGANSFFTSVASGVEGLARKPLEGAEQDGAAGFLKGMGKGLVGAVTKPAVGLFDLANGITEGIRNTTTVFEQAALDRVRLPRHIASDGVLRPFQDREALGQTWLKSLDNGQYFTEHYVAHLSMQPNEKDDRDLVVILTETRILLVRTLKLKTQWDIPLADLKTITLEAKGIALVLRNGRPGPFFGVPDRSNRLWLFSHLEKVVRAYNHTK